MLRGKELVVMSASNLPTPQHSVAMPHLSNISLSMLGGDTSIRKFRCSQHLAGAPNLPIRDSQLLAATPKFKSGTQRSVATPTLQIRASQRSVAMPSLQIRDLRHAVATPKLRFRESKNAWRRHRLCKPRNSQQLVATLHFKHVFI